MLTDATLALVEDAAREALAETRILVAAGAPVSRGQGLAEALRLLVSRIARESDRDIAVRGVAAGRGPDTPVRDVMTDEVIYCFDDDEVEAVALKMSDRQVRRMPVLSREDETLVGIVSLGDISRSEQSEAASVALDGITDPGGEHSQSEG